MSFNEDAFREDDGGVIHTTAADEQQQTAADPWETAAAAAGVSADSALAEAKAMAKLLNPLLDDDDAADDGAAVQRLDDSLDAVQQNLFQAEAEQAAEQVFQELLCRVGEANPRPRIEPVRRFAELAGLPQASYPIIQVAGTNGKTSTSRIIAAILQEHGMRTGLFTSPHLRAFTERFQIDLAPIDGVDLALAWQSLQPALEVVDAELDAAGQGRITFFEALAVLAFAAFADAPVEVAVIEVGMGGEWDATNIANADVAVFSPIALDHVGILGDTIAEIAATKAGIMKPGAVAVTAQQPIEAFAALDARAKELEIPLLRIGVDVALRANQQAVGGRLVTLESATTGAVYDDLLVNLWGAHQGENAALAVAAVEAFLGRELDREIVETALAEVTSPGRLQLVAKSPAVLVDAAHNPHGVAALTAAFEENFEFADGVCVVAGVLADKDTLGVLRGLAQLADRLILVPVESPRSVSAVQLAQLAPQLVTAQLPAAAITVAENCYLGFEQARDWAAAGAQRGVLVAGSVLLAGSAVEVAETEGW
ncbi:bifunctional folylpolyglutamate synthase/dihydrofolate synthase [Canibacter oris]|uniref:tetrahydrofolate synthase n=1 Tax=Canibacter oris TaxID=1365628 RepID=A0A840DGF1_9MICO|nr:Mur ligase family protein [Canibacter oris]MBB4070855.1 dihydrofolate synthase/folylpolyglutamate synthase [Canibacter oris]